MVNCPPSISKQDERAVMEALDTGESEAVVDGLEKALANAEHEKVKYQIRKTMQAALTIAVTEDR